MTIDKCLSRLSQCFGGKITGDQIAEWVDAMEGATADELNFATARLIKSSKYMPRPADVWTEIDRIRIERAPAPEPVEEHWQRRTYHCPACQDTGLRTVWHPQAMAASVKFIRGQMTEKAWRGKLSTCCVKCICSMGKAKRLHKERRFEPARYKGEEYEPGELTFKPAIMVEVPALPVTEQVEQLLQWAREWKEQKPANYEDGFDDWD